MSLLDYIIAPIPLRETFLVASRLTINGSFACNGSGVVIGQINGDVTAKGQITLAKKGVINGSVKAASMIIKGTITGNIYCEGKMKVAASALIKGNIITGEIDAEKNAVIEGSITKLTAKNIEEERNYFIAASMEKNDADEPDDVFSEDFGIPPIMLSTENIADEVQKEKIPQTWF